MKRNIVLFFSILMMVGFSVVVNADTVPVKDVYSTSYKNIYVLLENNTLLYGDTIDTANPQVVSTNVNKMIDYGSYLIVLYNNGMIDKIDKIDKIGKSSYVHTVEYSINANAIDIIRDRHDDFLYIDNSYALYKFDEYNRKSIPLFENVKTCKQIPNKDEALVISLDNKLYYIDYYKTYDIQSQLVLDNVVDVMANEDCCVFYRTNKELYSFSYSAFSDLMPQRITAKIDSFENVILYEDFCFYMIEDTVYRYMCNRGESLGEFATNVEEIQLLSEGLYIIYKDKSVYTGVGMKSCHLADTYNIKQFLTTKDFYVSTNGDLYRNSTRSNTTKASKYSRYFSGVERIFVCGADNFDKTYLFITDKGELYCSIGDVHTLGDPFLTSFCQKKTKVIINDKEIELETRIQIVNSRSMYPFRECLENMGAFVMWDSANRIAIGELNGITVEFPIDKNYYYINGQINYMDTTSYISNGRTYIPIRFAAEALGFTVEWESTPIENKISIFN